MKHFSSLNVTHKLLKELANSFDLYNSSLDTRCGKIRITPTKIRDALGLNSSEMLLVVNNNKQIFFSSYATNFSCGHYSRMKLGYLCAHLPHQRN
ncbi:hypothetical protein AHAS_Ahas05G0263000 [Arachis hypogaea]